MMNKQFVQPRLQSSQAHFAKVPGADIPRSMFNRASQLKTTFDAGFLVPIYCEEVVPGDTHKVKMTSFARLATPQTPFMDNLYADVFFFFVPNRLVWDNWERFMGAQDSPGASTDYLVPTLDEPEFTVGSMGDYFGLPTEVPLPAGEINALYFRAYNLIWNEWFRDQNLQNPLTVLKGDGPDDPTLYNVVRRGKRHDYFTSALPWTQKGPSVSLPLGSFAPIIRMPNADAFKTYRVDTQAVSGATSPLQVNGAGDLVGNDGVGRFFDVQESLQVDLSDATASTINQIREAFQVQKLLERDARGGTRYVELLKSHFGVTSPDFRLQRPEYLGGGSTMINTSPIPQTSSTDGTSPQGNLAALGTFSHHGVGFNKSFVEHGMILGFISVRADMTYQQGLNKMWTRKTRYDYYWPAFAHLGEQAVLNKEIYAVGTAVPGQDNAVFGYQERYAEYRYKPSQITGKFRSNYAQSLDVWHLAQDFSALPTLGASFIQENPPVERIMAVPSEPHFLLDVVFDATSARPMPVYSVPGLVDHF